LDRRLWSVEEDELVFDAAPYVQVHRQRICTDSGHVVDNYFQVTLPEFAICCPLTSDGRVITLWQYKHGARSWGLTFPAGLIDVNEGAEAAMRRELLEETGYIGGSAKFLGRYVCSGNQGAGWANLFVIRHCHRVCEPASGDLETMDLRLMIPSEIDALVADGAITGLPHLAIWTAARQMCSSAFGD